MPERKVKVGSSVGLHARPATIFTQAAAKQPVKVTIAERCVHSVVTSMMPRTGSRTEVMNAATAVTPGPTASTTPAPSWPVTIGGGDIEPSARGRTSVWHMPAATMRSRVAA